MTGNSFDYTLIFIILLLAFFTALMGYQHAIIKMDGQRTEQAKKVIIGFIEEILFFLPGSTEIAKVKKMRNLPDYKDISMEYLNYIIGIYNICGIYCYELNLTPAEIKENFGNYIAILTEDEILLNEINREPGFYKGAEYLLEVYR